MHTESTLQNWRSGTAMAERLAGALLQLEGYESIDPQHPLGGPDGGKDLLCKRGIEKWVAATYFPTTKPAFTKISAKFKSDFKGVASNKAAGFVFFINQHLTVTQRESLRKIGGRKKVEIYHLERIRLLLDAPKGCGIRLEYLRIAMTEEEQWSFWSTMNQDVVRRLVDSETRRDDQFRLISDKLDLVLSRTGSIEYQLTAGLSHLSETNSENIEMPTASLSVATLCWLHRLLTEDDHLPEAVRGRLRSINVWIGAPGSTASNAAYVPVQPSQIAERLSKLVQWWREQHPKLIRTPRAKVVSALGRLHHDFLQIHPFLDANGRVARVLIDQAARELLNASVGRELTADAPSYFSALRAADAGDMSQLESRISASLK